MVAISRRNRTVAHNIADVSFLLAVVVRRRPFFQENPSIMFLTLSCAYATRPSRGGATLRGGSFDQSVEIPTLHE